MCNAVRNTRNPDTPAHCRSRVSRIPATVRRLAFCHASAAPAALVRLKQTVIENGNVFGELMRAVRVCSLGQITNALFEVGGQDRRAM